MSEVGQLLQEKGTTMGFGCSGTDDLQLTHSLDLIFLSGAWLWLRAPRIKRWHDEAMGTGLRMRGRGEVRREIKLEWGLGKQV